MICDMMKKCYSRKRIQKWGRWLGIMSLLDPGGYVFRILPIVIKALGVMELWFGLMFDKTCHAGSIN